MAKRLRRTAEHSHRIVFDDADWKVEFRTDCLRVLSHERLVMMRCAMVLLIVATMAAEPLLAADKPVKVFILAEQSNMEGKAPNTLLDYQATDPKTK